MEEKCATPSSAANIITVICLGLFPLFTLCSAINIISDGYRFGLVIIWEIVSNAFKTGLLELNFDAIGFSFMGYLLISIWGIIALVLSFRAYLRNKESGKKPMALALILFGVGILVMAGLWFIGTGCVMGTLVGSSPACSLPVRPGVVAPTPSS